MDMRDMLHVRLLAILVEPSSQPSPSRAQPGPAQMKQNTAQQNIHQTQTFAQFTHPPLYSS